MTNKPRNKLDLDGLPCRACRKGHQWSVNVDYDERFNYEGQFYTVHIPQLPVIRCDHCGSITFDKPALQILEDALYYHLRLLPPSEIEAQRERIGMNQQQLADLLGVGIDDLDRWEKGHYYQPRSVDNLLRLVLFNEACRDSLSRQQVEAERVRQNHYLQHLSGVPLSGNGGPQHGPAPAARGSRKATKTRRRKKPVRVKAKAPSSR
jgi:putative zinc finger/helix-turn-helix YgiT family protein